MTSGQHTEIEVLQNDINVVWTRESTRPRTSNTMQIKQIVSPGSRRRGKLKQRWMDCFNRDMRAIGTTKDEVHDRTGWRRIVYAAATPQSSGSG